MMRDTPDAAVSSALLQTAALCEREATITEGDLHV